MKMEINKLSQHAAASLRDAADTVILSLEQKLKQEPLNEKHPAREHFENSRSEHIKAINQLKSVRADLNKRCFDAYKEECK